VQEKLNAVLPQGLRILESEEVDVKSPSISTLIDATRYRITIAGAEPEELQNQCVQFLAHDSFVIKRTKKGQTQEVDLRAETVSLAAAGQVVELVAKRGKPVEFVRAITGNEQCRAMTWQFRNWKFSLLLRNCVRFIISYKRRKSLWELSLLLMLHPTKHASR
jgi:radical SAM-linked protein